MGIIGAPARRAVRPQRRPQARVALVRYARPRAANERTGGARRGVARRPGAEQRARSNASKTPLFIESHRVADGWQTRGRRRRSVTQGASARTVEDHSTDCRLKRAP
jgi:hypothetical protein